jgi:hypothetical protein
MSCCAAVETAAVEVQRDEGWVPLRGAAVTAVGRRAARDFGGAQCIVAGPPRLALDLEACVAIDLGTAAVLPLRWRGAEDDRWVEAAADIVESSDVVCFVAALLRRHLPPTAIKDGWRVAVVDPPPTHCCHCDAPFGLLRWSSTCGRCTAAFCAQCAGGPQAGGSVCAACDGQPALDAPQLAYELAHHFGVTHDEARRPRAGFAFRAAVVAVLGSAARASAADALQLVAARNSAWASEAAAIRDRPAAALICHVDEVRRFVARCAAEVGSLADGSASLSCALSYLQAQPAGQQLHAQQRELGDALRRAATAADGESSPSHPRESETARAVTDMDANVDAAEKA